MKLAMVLCYLFTVYSLTSAHGDQEEFQVMVRVCGRHLARTLEDLCPRVAYEDAVKRSGPGGAAAYGTRGWPLAALGTARGTAREVARGKRWGIADECCNNACTLDVLLSYC
ncbi:bombyxin-related peptide A-like [Manduca sexta]|uniref:bombyxin-related peptide A-like n=1 Tax=Manduca sexta TaxID=7130 RepID=UPI0018908109|nr:bombyxin-related peptide A-like [Manduca sexta]